MTTPIERARAIRWGHQLISLLSDESIPADIRSRAISLQQDYPSPEELHRLLTSAANGLPAPWIKALHDAGWLFFDAHSRRPMYAYVTEAIRRTRHHFPATGEIDDLRADAGSQCLAQYVAAEDEKEQLPLPRVLLNVALHQRIHNSGIAQPSTHESAMQALGRLRQSVDDPDRT